MKGNKLCCPITGAYLPRLLLCAVVGFLFIMGFNFVLHQHLLMATYLETPQLWRSPEEMPTYGAWMMVGHFLTALFAAAIYSKVHCSSKGLMGGLVYGALLGLLMGTLFASSYAWMPISLGLAQAWFLGGLLQGVGLGFIYSLMYRASSCKDKSSR